MSEEQFTRSEIGHDANDLHNHGGLDAPEEKTEREDLENAIEALNDSEETEKLEKIENDIKGEPVNDQVAAAARELEEAQEEPVNAWKNKAENQAYMAAAPAPVTTGPKAKKKGGAGWKLATVFFFLLAAAGCGATAYLFFNNGKTELMGRVITSQEKGKAEQAKTAPSNVPEVEPAGAAFDFETSDLNYLGLAKLVGSDKNIVPKKINYTKDGKYVYVIAAVLPVGSEGAGAYYGVWYRENKKGSSWQQLQFGQDFMRCDALTDENKKFMEDYKYIDDDLGSKYIGCYADANNTMFPE